MKNRRLSEKKWFNGAVIVCIGVAFYALLTNLGPVMSAVSKFLGSFRSILLAIIFAYILNPFAKFFYYRVFKKMKLSKRRWGLSVAVAFLAALVLLALLIGMLIPQLVQSLRQFAANYESYAAKLLALIDGVLSAQIGACGAGLDLDKDDLVFIDSNDIDLAELVFIILKKL